MDTVMTENDQRTAWKADWPVVAYIIATVVQDKVEYVELPAVDDEHPDMPNRDLLKFPNHLAVAVQKSTHRPFRFHRFALGTVLANGKFVPSFSPRVDGYKSGKPVVDAGYWTALHGLLDRGETWQETDVTFQADEYVARDSPKQKVQTVARPGKTARARLKGKALPKAE